jgi:LmbE family N-acetylglucosaminyl deacetylase
MGTIDRFKQLLGRMLDIEREVIAKPASLDGYSPATALVVAPHSDDEILGCGGLLLELARKRCRLAVSIVTDGRRGIAFTSLREDALVRAREEETRSAAHLLHVEDCYFLREEDTGVRNTRSLRDKISSILTGIDPELILLPYLYDAHSDHRATAAATLQVLNDLRFTGQILMYEVWTPLPANKVIAIDWDAKQALIKQFPTQLGEEGFYLDGAKSLARYRAMTAMNAPTGYAECFLAWPLGTQTSQFEMRS